MDQHYKRKIAIGFSVFIILLSLSGVSSLWNLAGISNSNSHVHDTAYPVVRKATHLQIQLLKLAKLSGLAFNTSSLDSVLNYQKEFHAGTKRFSELAEGFESLAQDEAYSRAQASEVINLYEKYALEVNEMLEAKIALVKAKKQVEEEVKVISALVDEVGASILELIYFPVPGSLEGFDEEMALAVGHAEQADRLMLGVISTAIEIQKTSDDERLESALSDFDFVINDAMSWFDRSTGFFNRLNAQLVKTIYDDVSRLRARLTRSPNLMIFKEDELNQSAQASESLEAANFAVNEAIAKLDSLLAAADQHFDELQIELSSRFDFGINSILVTSLILIALGARHFKSVWQTIQKKVDDLATLNQVGHSLASVANQPTALTTVLKKIHHKTHLPVGLAFLKNDDDELELVAQQTTNKGTIDVNDLLGDIKNYLQDQIAFKKGTVFISDTGKADIPLDCQHQRIALLGLPLWNKENQMGMLVFAGPPASVNIDSSDFEFLSSMASGLVATIKNVRMREIIEETNRSLEATVVARTEALKQKSDDLNSMLSNLHQGLFTISESGVIHPEYAPFLERIFETTTIANQPFKELLFKNSLLDKNIIKTFEDVALSIFTKDAEFFEQHASQLVSKLILNFDDGRSKNLELSWDPIYNDDGLVIKLLVSVRDVTEYRKAEEQKDILAAMFKSSIEPIVVLDSQLYLKAVNNSFSELIGSEDELLISENLSSLLHKHHDGAFFDKIRSDLSKTHFWEGEVKCAGIDNKDTIFWLTISAIKNSQSSNELTYLGTFSDTVQRQKVEDELRYLANYDALTSLPNRRLFSDRLEHAIAIANRQRGSLAILFIDLNRFKYVNDTFGHSVGDALLVQVTSRLNDTLRASDTLCRLGGDEFTVLIEDASTEEDISSVANKLLAQFNDPFIVEDKELRTGASIGISVYPEHGKSAETLMINADVAMYTAKKKDAGYLYFEPHMKIKSEEILELENDLHRALDNNELFLVYQPKIDLETGEMIGAEVLLRWQHSVLGLISPDQFIPIAEESGLIIPIGKWVLETACKKIVSWQQQGMKPISLAVNVSAKQFQSAGFSATVSKVLFETGLSPDFLELEVTESLLMDTGTSAIGTLTTLKNMGIKLSIDDFGTGYSSLQYLSNFPIDYLKIDRSFVMGIDPTGKSVAIIRAIIAMALGLGLKVIAEGVEDESQSRLLKQFGCHYAQGYLYGRPLKEDAFIQSLLTEYSEA